MQGFENMTVRFFGYCSDAEDVIEISESAFQERVNAGAEIEYERHTVYANGHNQICLTANDFSA